MKMIVTDRENRKFPLEYYFEYHQLTLVEKNNMLATRPYIDICQ